MSDATLGGRFRGARPAPGARALVAAALSVLLALSLAALRPSLAKARATPPDPARVTALLDAVRGLNATACELAARSTAGRNWNGHSTMMPSSDTVARRLVSDVIDGELSAASVPVLRAALADADPCVRRVAAPLLGRIDDAAASAALITSLRDRAASTRYAAAIGLAFVGKRHAPSAIEPLIAALGDADASVRAASAWALGQLR